MTLRSARSTEDLARVARLRCRSYGRHVPRLGQLLQAPEAADLDGTATILMAECAASGRLLGSLRLHERHDATLPLEGSVTLPAWLERCALAEATRLCVIPGAAGAMARLELARAFYRRCLGRSIDWMVVSARAGVDRLYRRLLFSDLPCPEADDTGRVPLHHNAGVPHHILVLPVGQAAALWRARCHPLLAFMTEPDRSAPQPAEPHRTAAPDRTHTGHAADLVPEGCVAPA